MTTLKIFAGTDIGLRENNEDNFTVCPNLEENCWMVPPDYQQIIKLSAKGCLMVVADGMGGQNAGEVASAIAIETVQELFSSKFLTDDIVAKPEKIKGYLKKTIIEADVRIKNKTKENATTLGMGSTIILAWIIHNQVFVAWLGDSRAYCYVPNKGIGRLSKDHSYVQKLVDKHQLTDEQAMNHPDSNIITRSLGDTSQIAKPDVDSFPLEKGEIILLCSDGLCGVCKDELIGGILEEHYNDLKIAKERLTQQALANGGSDNITISLLKIVDLPQQTSSESNGLKYPLTSVNAKVIKALLLTIIIVGTTLFFGRQYYLKKYSQQVSKELTDSIKRIKYERDSIETALKLKQQQIRIKPEIVIEKNIDQPANVQEKGHSSAQPIQQSQEEINSENIDNNSEDTISNITTSLEQAPSIINKIQ